TGFVATVSCLALSLVFACGQREESDSATAAADSVEGRSQAPLIDPAGVTVREAFALSPAEADRAGLRQPRDLAIDGEGKLYVLDFEAPDHRRIVAFDSAGGFAYRFGERDDRADRVGPSDQLAVTPWNYVMFVDKRDNALTSFLTMGTYVSTAGLNGIGMSVVGMPEYGQFYLKKWDPGRGRAYVIHMQLPIDSVSMVYEVRMQPGQSVRKDARDVSFLTAGDGAGRLYVAFGDVYQVRVLDRTGATVRVVRSSRPAVRKSPREMEAERQRIRARLEAQVEDVPDSLLQDATRPDSLHPLVEELAVDPAGRLWVRTHRPERTTGTVYDVFNEQGQLISWVAVPATVRRTAFSPSGRLYVIDERDPARPAIVAYDVTFGAAVPEANGG
ncbi:MAG TPA: hypothetical protein VJ788_05140, partial [Gemmatimonadota bacterium]|nr:hypothetical protein [Gemmatimonadota bacterium]